MTIKPIFVSAMIEYFGFDELRLMNASSDDSYIISQFGLMDAILDEKLGFTPKREEGDLLLVSR